MDGRPKNSNRKLDTSSTKQRLGEGLRPPVEGIGCVMLTVGYHKPATQIHAQNFEPQMSRCGRIASALQLLRLSVLKDTQRVQRKLGERREVILYNIIVFWITQLINNLYFWFESIIV